MKKALIPFCLAVATAIACLGAVACGPAREIGPSQTVSSALNAIIEHNYDELQNYYSGTFDGLTEGLADTTDADSLSLFSAAGELSDEQRTRLTEALNKFLEFDYKLGEEKIDGDKATVNVTFTNYDVGKVTSSLLGDTFPALMGLAFGGQSDPDAAFDTIISGIETATADLGEKNVSNDVQIRLTKDAQGVWKLDALDDDEDYSKEVINAMFGGVIDTTEDWANNMLGGLGLEDGEGLDSAN